MITTTEAKRLALVLSSVLNAIEDAKHKASTLGHDARSGDWMCGYADGIAAASTIAKVTAADAMKAAATVEL